MYTVVVAEDNSYLRTKLISELIRHPFEVIDETGNGEELIQIVHSTKPDVIFVDIGLHKVDGVSASKEIKTFHPEIIIIFVTSYVNYATNAFDIEALDYIVKPFSKERLNKCIHKIIRNLQKKKSNNILIKVKGGYRVIPNQEIVYVTSQNKITKVFLVNNQDPIITTETLSSLKDRLSTDIFFRTHRSYIVNLNYVAKIENSGRTNIIYLKNRKDYIFLSSRFLPLLFRRFN